jgi:transmembrane sensor
MSKQGFDSLLDKYRAEKCTAEEKILVEQWYELVGNDSQLPKSENDWYSLRGKMWKAIQEQTQNETIIIPFWKTQFFKIGVAACLLLAFGMYFYFPKNSENQLVTTISNALITQENLSPNTVPIRLEDGSLVELSPKAKISYPQHFLSDKREVSLEGDAFFDIHKNPEKPFFITTGNTITKVLGTSFFIRSSKKSKIEVEVKTGRVAVYEKNAKNKKDNGVLLTPNLKVTFFEDNKLFVTGLVEKPMIQAQVIETKKIDFVFDETPLSEVLAKLEEAYGIEITTDNEKLNHSLLTADITQQDLYTKLDIICTAINAHYEVKGTSILITQP